MRSGTWAHRVCAAGSRHSVPFADLTPEVWEETLARNLTGCFLLPRGVPHHVALGRGRIVNIASALRRLRH